MLPRCTARREDLRRSALPSLLPRPALPWPALRRPPFHRAALLLAALSLGAGCRAVPAPEAELPRAVQARPAPADPHHRLIDAVALPTGEAEFTTTRISDGAPFDRVIPSWNVPHAGAPFRVDVRARTASGWTPWLRIGDWNVDARGSDAVTESDGAKVAVDVLDLERPADACELRLRTDAGSAVATSSALRFSVVLSDRSTLDARVASASAEPWPAAAPVSIDVPKRSQRVDGGEIGGRICSPTSVAMTLEHFGAGAPTVELAHQIFDPHFGIFGNWNRAVQAAFDRGVPGRLVGVSSWATVARYLERGQPLVASIRAGEGELRGAPYTKTAGHLLVVTGLGAHGAVHVNDPASKTTAAVSRVYRREDVERVWFANGGVAYALGPEAAE
ncbi:MAG: C39 family peptidase [Planctomycetota bacterium]